MPQGRPSDSVRAASSNPGEVTKSLRPVLTQATSAGLVNYQLEAHLAPGEAEIRSGNTAGKRAQFLAL